MGTLLIIDDSEAVRKELVDIVAGDGDFKRFLHASDGAAGLKILNDEEKKVDVVACDLNMPRMDGFGFLRMVRANPRLMGVPVVMVTSQSDVTEVVKAFELGANDFIVKPFNPSILRVRLRNMLHIKHLQDLLTAQREMMETLAITDPLTNIPNLRCFTRTIEDECHRARRYQDPLSLLMIDLDHFKGINDTYGHQQGDEVLRECARILMDVMRKVDMVARYGGEEFVIVMPHTDEDGARTAAERVRAAFEGHHFEGLPEKGCLTVSVGAAVYAPEEDRSVELFIERADKALYGAKAAGRNRIEVATQDSA